jgi:hypothetical protein
VSSSSVSAWAHLCSPRSLRVRFFLLSLRNFERSEPLTFAALSPRSVRSQVALHRPDVALLPLRSSWMPYRFVDASPPFFFECKLTLSSTSFLPSQTRSLSYSASASSSSPSTSVGTRCVSPLPPPLSPLLTVLPDTSMAIFSAILSVRGGRMCERKVCGAR